MTTITGFGERNDRLQGSSTQGSWPYADQIKIL
jgi:hypothetical protein